MPFARIGGLLVVGGWVLVAATAAIVAGGGAVGVGGSVGGNVGSLTLATAVAMVGSGAGLLAIAGPIPLNGRAVRVGLGLLAIGLIAQVAAIGGGGAVRMDQPEIWVVLAFALVGLLGTSLGTLLTVVSLMRAGGRSRRVGSLFLAGLVLLVLAVLVSKIGRGGLPYDVIAAALAVLGAVGVFVGGAGIGLLGIAGERPPSVALA